MQIQEKFSFVTFEKVGDKYLIDIPVENRLEHETHFGHVAEKFFDYLVERNMPEWENANTIAKYYITTTAVEMANK